MWTINNTMAFGITDNIIAFGIIDDNITFGAFENSMASVTIETINAIKKL